MNKAQRIASLEKSLHEAKVMFFNSLSDWSADRAEKQIASLERSLEIEPSK
jgi:hypothetical protein